MTDHMTNHKTPIRLGQRRRGRWRRDGRGGRCGRGGRGGRGGSGGRGGRRRGARGRGKGRTSRERERDTAAKNKKEKPAYNAKLKTKVSGHRVVVDQGTVTLGLLERMGKDFPRLRFYEEVGHTNDQFSRVVLLDNGVDRSRKPAFIAPRNNGGQIPAASLGDILERAMSSSMERERI